MSHRPPGPAGLEGTTVRRDGGGGPGGQGGGPGRGHPGPEPPAPGPGGHPAAPGRAPRPLEGSILWRYAGDHRIALTGLAAGVLQLMHPAIAAGVEQHSSFFEDPWGRVVRSAPQILGVIYDPDPEATGRKVRDYHRPIQGRDAAGRRYRALQPDVFWWAHATFQNAVEQLVDRFDHHRLSGPERESLYLDGVEWYRRYGVSLRPVPPDHAAFRAEWERHCAEVLELTPAAERAVDMAMHSPAIELPMLPAWTRPLQLVTVPRLVRLTILGSLPRVVRQRFSIPWRIDEELEYRAVQLWFRETWRLLPPVHRYGPTAAAGMRAARARVEATAGATATSGPADPALPGGPGDPGDAAGSPGAA